MGFGIFGKLPQKRDFISFGITQHVLNPLETWLQSAVAASRSELGRDWEQRYLVAPIWRFWLGKSIFGNNCAGALMPSVDGVGRYFPLLAVYVCDGAESMSPPPFAPQGDWFAAIETRLLAALRDETQIAADALLADLPPPSLERTGSADQVERFKGGPIWRAPPGISAAALLTEIVEDDYREAAAVRSYWWTAGNQESGPLLYTKEGLPDPYFYTMMIKAAPS